LKIRRKENGCKSPFLFSSYLYHGEHNGGKHNLFLFFCFSPTTITKMSIFATESEGEILGSEGNRAYIEVCKFWKNW